MKCLKCWERKVQAPHQSPQHGIVLPDPAVPLKYSAGPTSRPLLHHGGRVQQRLVPWASLGHKGQLVPPVSALLVGIRQGELGLAAHLSYLEDQVVWVRTLCFGSDDPGDQARGGDSLYGGLSAN